MPDKKDETPAKAASPPATACALSDQRATLQTDAATLQMALTSISQGVIMYDSHMRLIYCNPRYAEMYRLPKELTVPGTAISRIVDWRAEHNLFQGADRAGFRESVLNAVCNGVSNSPVHQLPDGRVVAVSHQALPTGGGIATHEDITNVRSLQERLRYLTQRDSLTGLYNRGHFREQLEARLAQGPDQRLAVFRIDLGRFHAIRDTHGQRSTETILETIGQRLAAGIGVSDIAARTENNFFLVMQAAAQQTEDVSGLATRIVDDLRKPYDLDGATILLDPKVGIAMFPDDGRDVDTLLSNADTALQGAQIDEGFSFQFFEPAMDSESKARRNLEIDLAKAIKNGEIEVHYQPLINLERREIIGCEALARWKHPERGYIPPDVFIPVAEATGLITELGTWVLRQACAEAASWPARIKIAVNLSPVQIRSGDLPKTVSECLANAPLAPSRLELEITEAILLDDNEQTLGTLTQLKKLGARISMDDFGTGYSSLGYLRRFPFDKIKIDRSFICDLASEDPASHVLMRAIARVGTSLGITTLAEGIETEEQCEIVRQEGCIEAQGYLFGRPQPSAQIRALLWTQLVATPHADTTPTAEAPKRSVDKSLKYRQTEEARLRALYELEVLDTPPEEAFDRITRLAKSLLNAPMAMISLVDRDRQWFKSRQGVPVDETPRHFSFCTHTIEQTDPLLVNDALLDPRFANSPLVTGGSKVRAYAGVPLRTGAGYNVGALCINDVVPRDLSGEQIALLQDLAQLAVDELELRRIALVDSVTGAMTARNFRKLSDSRILSARESGVPVTCFVTDFAGFREFNNLHGHAVGDLMLSAAARALSQQLAQNDLIGRLGGDGCALLQIGLPRELARLRVEELKMAIEAECRAAGYSIVIRMGLASLSPEDLGMDDLMARALEHLRSAKSADKAVGKALSAA
jgi:diguanylate cyclase (GGDEF)-like protein